MSDRYGGSEAKVSLLPLPQEVADRLHDGVLALDLRDHQAVVLVEVLVEILDELAGAVRALDLAVAEQVHLWQDLRLEDVDALDRVVDRPVVAVGEVKRVDVPLRRGEIVVDHLGAQLVRARDHGAARLAGAEEGVAVDLLGDRVVDDVPRLEPLVLAAQPSIDPERFDAHDLLLLVAHRPGDVHDEEHHGVRLRQRRGPPGPIPAILAHRHDDRVLGVVRPGHDLPPQRLAEGALEVAQRLRAGPPDPDVAVLLRDDPLLALGLDAGELQLLAHDLRQLLQRQLDLQGVLARLVAGLAAAVGVGIALAQAVADVALPLPDAAPILAAEAEPGDVDLRQGDGDQVLALAADQLALRDVLAQVLLDLAAHDVAEAAVVGIDPQRHLRSPDPRTGGWPRRRPPAAALSPWPRRPVRASRARGSRRPAAAPSSDPPSA